MSLVVAFDGTISPFSLWDLNLVLFMFKERKGKGLNDKGSLTLELAVVIVSESCWLWVREKGKVEKNVSNTEARKGGESKLSP